MLVETKEGGIDWEQFHPIVLYLFNCKRESEGKQHNVHEGGGGGGSAASWWINQEIWDWSHDKYQKQNMLMVTEQHVNW